MARKRIACEVILRGHEADIDAIERRISNFLHDISKEEEVVAFIIEHNDTANRFGGRN